MPDKKPIFAPHHQIARYIREEERQNNGRAKPTAFMEDADATRDGLSVNAVEVETINQIAAVYAEKFENGKRPVALCVHDVADYNEAADAHGVTVRPHDEWEWSHTTANGEAPSYVLNPRPRNNSHCLVKYSSMLGDREWYFSRRLARQPKFKMY